MQSILDVLFVATNALLWPVLFGIFIMMAYSLFSLGATLREAISRKKVIRERLAAFAKMEPDERTPELARTEMRFARVVDRDAMISRLGPMFGLAGTLIPLGPGLRKLHSGDLDGLGEQLAVAFSTTVAGLFVCTICYIVANVRGRWYEQQLRMLERVSGVPLDG